MRMRRMTLFCPPNGDPSHGAAISAALRDHHGNTLHKSASRLGLLPRGSATGRRSSASSMSFARMVEGSGAAFRTFPAEEMFYLPSLRARRSFTRDAERAAGRRLLPDLRDPRPMEARWPWFIRASSTNTFSNWAAHIPIDSSRTTARSHLAWQHQLDARPRKHACLRAVRRGRAQAFRRSSMRPGPDSAMSTMCSSCW